MVCVCVFPHHAFLKQLVKQAVEQVVKQGIQFDGICRRNHVFVHCKCWFHVSCRCCLYMFTSYHSEICVFHCHVLLVHSKLYSHHIIHPPHGFIMPHVLLVTSQNLSRLYPELNRTCIAVSWSVSYLISIHYIHTFPTYYDCFYPFMKHEKKQ